MKSLITFINEKQNFIIKGHTTSQKILSESDMLKYVVYGKIYERKKPSTTLNVYFLKTSNNPAELGINSSDTDGDFNNYDKFLEYVLQFEKITGEKYKAHNEKFDYDISWLENPKMLKLFMKFNSDAKFHYNEMIIK